MVSLFMEGSVSGNATIDGVGGGVLSIGVLCFKNLFMFSLKTIISYYWPHIIKYKKSFSQLLFFMGRLW